MERCLLFIFLFSPLTLLGQFTYVIDQSIPVHDLNNNLLSMPWAGGINAVQHNTLDLNGDDKMDLVLFDRMANKVLTYVNNAGQYVYDPAYEVFFPKEITNWILLRDYNCDGKKDLFTSDILGIKVYTNTTEAGEILSWKQFYFFAVAGETKSPVLLTKGFSNLINLQLQYDDLPSIIDADGDGDLDIFNILYSGSSVEFHKNFSQERYGTCDSLAFERVTQTWGDFTECGCGSFAFHGEDCPPLQGGRTEHAGGKSLLALDVDDDHDLDLLFSEASCTSLYLMKNEGTTANPIINTRSNFPDDNPVNFYIFPAAYYEDLDFDGLSDLVATPNIYSKVYFNSNLAASNWFYKNTGTQQLPVFSFVKTNFLQDRMIDVGDNAVPAFLDYDGDGDFDLFISQHASPNFRATVSLYENTGATGAPSFKLIATDYFGFSFSNLYNLKIQFVDITGDNSVDLVYTATSFQDGVTRIAYLSDILHPAGNFVQTINFTLATNENIYFTDIGGNSNGTPDGKPDILVGRSNGALEYWENAGLLNFVLKNNSFLGLKPSVTRQSPACTVTDLDNDSKADLILSDQFGSLSIIGDFMGVAGTAESVSDIVLNPLQDSTYLRHNFGGRTWPTTVNLFNTDKPVIVVGNLLGGVQVLKHSQQGSLSEDPRIQIFPNPVRQADALQIRVDRPAHVQVFSSLGQKINEPVLLKANQTTLFTSSLARGVYFFRFTINKKTYTKRVVIY